PDCSIACESYDGTHLPFADASFDACVIVDVLHHAAEPAILLRDACRVSRRCVVIKDHFAQNRLDHWTLRLMDWVGNRPHGVRIPYCYRSRSQWREVHEHVGLTS